MIERLRNVGMAALLLSCGAMMVGDQALVAADHLDSPSRTDGDFTAKPDRAADIADVFVWYTPTDVVLALTFAGPDLPGAPPRYDRDVLYSINVSNDGDPTTTEFPIEVRFGQDASGGPVRDGVQVKGLPGGAVVAGPVETRLEQNGILVQAGLFDDPFYFDLQGFRETRSTGTLSFNNKRDFFAGKNDTAFVIQVPRAMIQSGNKPLHVWSSTARFGGRL